MKIRQTLYKLIAADVPAEVRLGVAMRLLPKETALAPEDEVTALFILSRDKNQDVATAAKKSLDEYPASRMQEALEWPLDPLVLGWAAPAYEENDAVLSMIALNPGVDDGTLVRLAETGPEEVIMILADDKKRILQNPAILEALKRNPLAAKTVVDALDAYVKSGGAAPVEILPAPALSEEQTELAENAPAEEAAAILEAMKPPEKKPTEASRPEREKPDRKDTQNIYKMAAEMSFGQKIKLALTGNKSVREFFAKDANKLISTSVLKNPRITENEILKIAVNKSSPDALLRHIASKKDWLKNYPIKLSVTTNPKTPLAMSLKLMESLQLKDIEIISKSKNVPIALVSAARRKLDSKKKG